MHSIGSPLEGSSNGTHAELSYEKVYAGIVESLQTSEGGGALGQVLRTLRQSGIDEALPLMEDADVQRMFRRLGWIPARASAPAAGKRAEEIVRDAAVALDRTPAQISVLFRLYAAGLYGVIAKPVCGNVPQCMRCGISKFCDHFNAPLPTASRERTPLHKRFTFDGAEAMSDSELVSLLLGASRVGKNHEELASRLLERYGSLRSLARANVTELSALRDVGEAAAIRLSAFGALYRRTVEQRRQKGPAIRCGQDFFDLYAPVLRDRKKEVFLVVLLDQKNRVLRDEYVSEGTLTESLVHPREVFTPAIRESAASVAFVHNHPSGDCVPSPEDMELTHRLVETGRLVGIRVLDHVVIGDDCFTSFVDEGIMT